MSGVTCISTRQGACSSGTNSGMTRRILSQPGGLRSSGGRVVIQWARLVPSVPYLRLRRKLRSRASWQLTTPSCCHSDGSQADLRHHLSSSSFMRTSTKARSWVGLGGLWPSTLMLMTTSRAPCCHHAGGGSRGASGR